MILIVVGLHKQGFKRLIMKMDEIGPKIDDEIIMQIGHTDFTPKNVPFFRFKTNDEIRRIYLESDLVITHGGVGSIMTALRFGKPVISVPRLSRYDEHKNDHQLDIVDLFNKKNLIKVVYNVDFLLSEINSLKKRGFLRDDYIFGNEREKLLNYIKYYLNSID